MADYTTATSMEDYEIEFVNNLLNDKIRAEARLKGMVDLLARKYALGPMDGANLTTGVIKRGPKPPAPAPAPEIASGDLATPPQSNQ